MPDEVDQNKPIDYEQDHMATTNFSREQLVERCEVLESMLDAEKALNESYLYSQQVIIDHLAETNEGYCSFSVSSSSFSIKERKEARKSRKSRLKIKYYLVLLDWLIKYSNG